MENIKFLDLDGLKYYNRKISTSLSEKVDKEIGKTLTTNDYTDADKNKLLNIEDEAQVNVIEEISINGVAQDITEKAVNITIPTNNSELENGAGYQTAADVIEAINNSLHIKKRVVNELPQQGEDNIIYFIPNNSDSGDNIMNEYMWINGKWEKTGSGDVDLSGYIQKTDIITHAMIDSIVSGGE